VGKRPAEKMPLSQRAKQFAPFDALKGFKEAIQDVNYQTELVDRIILSEDQLDKLDEIAHSLNKGERITITYYHKGRYLKLSGVFTKIDEIEKVMVMGGEVFGLGDIIEIHRTEEASIA